MAHVPAPGAVALKVAGPEDGRATSAPCCAPVAVEEALRRPVICGYLDVTTREVVGVERALADYACYTEGSSKHLLYRCDLPHPVVGRSGMYGFVNIRYRAARDTHYTRKCQLPGSREARNTPRRDRKRTALEMCAASEGLLLAQAGNDPKVRRVNGGADEDAAVIALQLAQRERQQQQQLLLPPPRPPPIVQPTPAPAPVLDQVVRHTHEIQTFQTLMKLAADALNYAQEEELRLKQRQIDVQQQLQQSIQVLHQQQVVLQRTLQQQTEATQTMPPVPAAANDVDGVVASWRLHDLIQQQAKKVAALPPETQNPTTDSLAAQWQSYVQYFAGIHKRSDSPSKQLAPLMLQHLTESQPAAAAANAVVNASTVLAQLSSAAHHAAALDSALVGSETSAFKKVVDSTPV